VVIFKPESGVEPADFEANLSVLAESGFDLSFCEMISVHDRLFAALTVQCLVIDTLEGSSWSLLWAVDGFQVLAILRENLAISHNKHRHLPPVFAISFVRISQSTCIGQAIQIAQAAKVRLTRRQSAVKLSAWFG
jgi:hypothetical protein